MHLQGILYDFDGLILDTETSEFVTVAESFRHHGLELSRQEWVHWIGRADHPHWTDMLETALGHPLGDREEVLETRRARHHAIIAEETVKPGVLELADAARAMGLGVAIASSSPLDWIEGHLHRLGISDRFGPRATRDDVGKERAKPNPDLFLLAAERLDVDPRRCVVLEDSWAGVTAGNAAGCFTVAVPGGMTADVDFGHADLVVDSLAALSVERLDAVLTARS